MTLVCDRCSRYIEADNRKWPGYCTADCRDLARADRDHAAAILAAKRAQSRHDRAELARRVHYVT